MKSKQAENDEISEYMQSENEILEKGSNCKQKKPVIIVGDPILNGINENGLSRKSPIASVCPNSGATSED